MKFRYSSVPLAAALILTLACLVPASVQAFGKNKITYRSFGWMTHTTDHFVFYYYPEEADQVPGVIEFFEEAYARISFDLGTDLTGTTPIILYKTQAEFRQTNILSDFIPVGVAGFTEPIKRRVVIPLTGSRDDLEELIIHELTHAFEFEIFFQNRISRIAPVPLWVMEGLSEHMANDWDAVGRMVLRDAIINNLLPSLEQLETFNYLYSPYLGYKASQSVLDFLRKEYGIEKLRRFLWEVRKTLRTTNYLERSFQEIYGKSFEQVSNEWREDLRRRFIELERKREGTVNFPVSLQAQKPFTQRFSPVFTPGGEMIAYLEYGREGFHVYLGSTDQEKKREFLCLTEGLDQFRHRQVITDGRPLGGNPWNDTLVYINSYDNKFFAKILDPARGGLVDSVRIREEQPTSPMLSPDETKLVFAGYRDGQSDIFILDIPSGESRRLTNDPYIDETPAWSPDGKFVVFCSERDGQYDIFLANTETGGIEPLITSPAKETTPVFSPDGRMLAYISDRQEGVNDPYILDLETSQIRRIAAPVTGMFEPSFSADSKSLALVFFYDGTRKIVVVPVVRDVEIPEVAADAPDFSLDGELIAREFGSFKADADIPDAPEALDNAEPTFRLIPDYAVGMITYGTDGDLTVEGGVYFSDTLSDHQFAMIAVRRDNRNGIYTNYKYLRQRIDYGVGLLLDSDYYYLYDASENRFRKVEWDYYGLTLHSEYSFNTFYRVELNLGYYNRDYDSDISFYERYDEQYMYLEPVLSGDTVQYRNMAGYPEVYRGHRFRFSVEVPLAIADEFEEFTNTRYDYRAYIPLTRRSVVAIREWGVFSAGDAPLYFGVGGYDTIRGYEYNRLVGNNVMISNMELRFPLLDVLQFPGGVRFTGFRGKFFIDAAAVWAKGEDEEFKFDDPDTPVMEGNIYGAAGMGINFWFIGVEWHFEWARKTNFENFGGEWVYQWSLRRSF